VGEINHLLRMRQKLLEKGKFSCEVKKYGVRKPARVFGMTTLGAVGASTFTANALNRDDPQTFKILVIGGHSGEIILPLIN
jgi:malate/lactate dehydrogenase